MKGFSFFLALVLLNAGAASAQQKSASQPSPAPASNVIVNLAPKANPLWPDGAPGALGTADKDIPSLTAYFAPPEKATGAATVICPGGGYAGLMMSREGADYARWLNEHGIAGFVLKYRLGTSGYHHPAMLQDAARALRTVRFHAKEWNLDTNRIGIMGSSAGGHLAATLLTHFDSGNPQSTDPIDRVSSRPNLGILCYPVIEMAGKFAHAGSRKNLLGSNPSPELEEELSAEKHVTKETPPCFIFHRYEDKTVPVENSLHFAEALSHAKVPYELHVYQRGPHGLGLGSNEYDPAKFHPWVAECARWLKEEGFGN